MNANRVDLVQTKPMLWRNGGGLTRELLQWPAGGRPDSWRLRVSVADVEHSGPFSPYPGIDRWIAVLEGAGATLALPSGARTITPADEPLTFPGEDQPHCHLLQGRTRDLNLMVRRGGGLSARMTQAHAGESVEGSTRWRALYAHGAGRIEIDGVVEPLHSGLLLWSDSQDDSPWRLLEGTRAWWMVIT